MLDKFAGGGIELINHLLEKQDKQNVDKSEKVFMKMVYLCIKKSKN